MNTEKRPKRVIVLGLAGLLCFLSGAALFVSGLSSSSSLTQAAYDGDLDRVRELLDDGTHPDTPGAFGEIALMEAAGEGHTEVVRLLLERGANPNLQLVEGHYALLMAASRGQADPIDVLLSC